MFPDMTVPSRCTDFPSFQLSRPMHRQRFGHAFALLGQANEFGTFGPCHAV
jgi:hypothetical protein